MSGELVLVDRRDAVLRVTINRPEARNALSRATLTAIGEAFRSHASGPGVCVCVLRGAGELAFAAGGDLKELASVRTLEEATRMAEDARSALDSLREMPVPVVAALNGDALGGGAELALACDFRVAASHARIGFIQGRLNISTGWGGGIDLARRVGQATALRLLARAELLGAADAKQVGLVDEVVEQGETLDQAIDRFIAPMVAQKPQVIRAFKAIARSGSVQMEARLFAQTWVHDDHWAAAERVMRRP